MSLEEENIENQILKIKMEKILYYLIFIVYQKRCIYVKKQSHPEQMRKISMDYFELIQ
jgi:hypothetical protein